MAIAKLACITSLCLARKFNVFQTFSSETVYNINTPDFAGYKNINQLITKIKNNLKNKFITNEDIYITRERHREHLKNCLMSLKEFDKKNSLEDFDKAAEDLRLATRNLGMIVGKVGVEELLGSIFNDFCIGK